MERPKVGQRIKHNESGSIYIITQSESEGQGDHGYNDVSYGGWYLTAYPEKSGNEFCVDMRKQPIKGRMREYMDERKIDIWGYLNTDEGLFPKFESI